MVSEVIKQEPPQVFGPEACVIECACGVKYDVCTNTERKKHYFHRKHDCDASGCPTGTVE